MPADKATVWNHLLDPEVLKACIPACHSLERTGATTYVASAKIKIGPLTATFKGNVYLSNLDPPNRCRIEGAGEGGLAGMARGGVDVTLHDVPGGGTVLSYDWEGDVGGRVARLGSKLIGGVAGRVADTFFTRFAAVLSQ